MSSGLNVLIADEPDVAGEAALLVRRWGHQGEQTHDGFTAVEAARRIKPDLMLIGVGLPLLNGFGVAREVRESPELHRTKLIAVINRSHEMPPGELRRAGFSGVLTKPIVPLALLDTLLKTREALAKSQQLSQESREAAARSRARSSSARQGLAESAQAIRSSHQSLNRTIRTGGPGSPSFSIHALMERLISTNRLTHEQTAVATKILAGGAESLLPGEVRIHAALRQRYLEPVCKLCRYRIPREEVADAWTNGGYCNLCAEALR